MLDQPSGRPSRNWREAREGRGTTFFGAQLYHLHCVGEGDEQKEGVWSRDAGNNVHRLYYSVAFQRPTLDYPVAKPVRRHTRVGAQHRVLKKQTAFESNRQPCSQLVHRARDSNNTRSMHRQRGGHHIDSNDNNARDVLQRRVFNSGRSRKFERAAHEPARIPTRTHARV